MSKRGIRDTERGGTLLVSKRGIRDTERERGTLLVSKRGTRERGELC